MTKRIAIIGSGVAGLTTAYWLNPHYDVSLFEANDYLGGHTHTIDLEIDHQRHRIDTGFIVFNKKTYPLFNQLIESLEIPIQKSEMSFSYRSTSGDLEYNGHNLNTLFADRRNLYKTSFYRFIAEIIRFNRDAKEFILEENNQGITIRDFINQYGYSDYFVKSYLIPMMSSIWSKNKSDTLNCSAYFILKFYENHGLLETHHRPQWYVIKNGSSSYIPYLTKDIRTIKLNCKIEKIHREHDQIQLLTKDDAYHFDAVVIATHSDQALKLLDQPTEDEIALLNAIPYSNNEVILHTDHTIMPKRRRAWASWNFWDQESDLPQLTYYMNRLQGLKTSKDFFVSVNQRDWINEDKIIQIFEYAHPCLNQKATDAQKQLHLINGKQSTYFVGAYWGYGFHEDAVKSAFNTTQLIRSTLK